MVNFLRLELELLLAYLLLDIADESNYLLYLLVTCEDSFQHLVFGDFISTGFDHNDLLGRTCNCEDQVCLGSLFESGVENYLAVNKTYADTGDRAVPRDIGYGDSDSCSYHTCDLG